MFILGLIVGSFVANKIRGKLGVISMVIFFFTGALIALVSFLNSIFFVMIPAVVIGILVGIANVIYGASMLHIVSQEFMARISGAFNTFSVAATFSSGMLGGAIIQLTSVSDSFLVVGGFVMASVILWPFFREIYRITV